MLQPVAGAIWQAGESELIRWDAQWRRPDGRYYNNVTRVTVELYHRRDNLVKVIQRDYPFALGQLLWDVPVNVTNARGQSVALGNAAGDGDANYYLLVYPSYFDFPGRDGCARCKSSTPRGPMFVIKQAGKCLDRGTLMSKVCVLTAEFCARSLPAELPSDARRRRATSHCRQE